MFLLVHTPPPPLPPAAALENALELESITTALRPRCLNNERTATFAKDKVKKMFFSTAAAVAASTSTSTAVCLGGIYNAQ